MKKGILFFSILAFSVFSVFSQEIISSANSLQKEKNDSIIFFDNFDSYAQGESLFEQNPDDWFMFTGAPGPWSPKITDTFALSNPNSVSFNLSWETIIKPVNNFDTGIYLIEFFLYLPENKTGAFTTLNYFDGENISYGMKVNFNENGQGSVFAGGFDSTIFSFNYNTWLHNRIIVDLNTDWTGYFLNDNIIDNWIWSSGIGPNFLGGSNFFGHYYGDTEFLLDDYKLTKLDNSTFFDYFETYNSNEQLACQNPNQWTTWNNLPCSYEDPIIVDTFAYESSQSVLIQDSNSLVRPISKLTEGIYKISFQMFVPVGEQGVFSILQEFNGDSSIVGCRMNFYNDGSLEIDNGSLGWPGTYIPGTWMKNIIIIDLNEDWVSYFLNNVLYSEWQWSLGVSGTNNLNQLGGVNFRTNSWIVDEALYFIDDYKIEELENLQLLPPENLTLETSGNDIILNWDSSCQGEWFYWDYGNNGNGIGTNGDSIFIASRWDTTDLSGYNGFYLSKIKFFAQSNTCTYSLRVWTGENANTLFIEQDVTDFEPFSWNEIQLNNPVLIDDSQELWIGYVCTSQMGECPASCDDGPAIQYKGDMISFDGNNWVSMSAEYGLDNNWNIAACISEIADNNQIAKPLKNNTLETQSQSPQAVYSNKKAKTIFTELKDKFLLGYNVYHSFNLEPFELLNFTTENSFSHQNLIIGNHSYYVTALYEEGESTPSDTVSAFLTAIIKNEMNRITINPNPAKDYIEIQSNKLMENISLINLSGKVIRQVSKVEKFNYTIMINNINPGIYLIKIETEIKTIHKKIVIQ